VGNSTRRSEAEKLAALQQLGRPDATVLAVQWPSEMLAMRINARVRHMFTDTGAGDLCWWIATVKSE
jgi:hypothetical protein